MYMWCAFTDTSSSSTNKETTYSSTYEYMWSGVDEVYSWFGTCPLPLLRAIGLRLLRVQEYNHTCEVGGGGGGGGGATGTERP